MANQAIRQEINLLVSTGISSGTLTLDGNVELDTTKYDSNTTYWFEAVYAGAASNTGTIKLHDIAAASNVASLTGATSGTYIISRVQFTPTAGAREYMVQLVGDGTRTQVVNAARIIILQSETSITKTQTQIEIGSESTGLSNTTVADITTPKFWNYTAGNWDGTTTFFVEVVWRTSAKNTTTITLCRTSDNAANVTVVNAGSNSTGYTRTRVSFTPVNGETYKLRSLGSTTKSNYSIRQGKIIVVQTNTPTKISPQFLILDQLDSTVVVSNLARCFTTWNLGEWDAGAGTVTYYHAMDSDNAANSIKLRNVTDSDDVTSTVTGSGQQVSSALTVGAGELVTGKNYDCWVIDSTGAIASSRILVLYVFVATAARRIFVTGG